MRIALLIVSSFFIAACTSTSGSLSKGKDVASRKLATRVNPESKSDIVCTIKIQNPGAEITYGEPIFSGKVFPNNGHSTYFVIDDQELILTTYSLKRGPVSERFTSKKNWEKRVSQFVYVSAEEGGLLHISHGLYKVSEHEFYGTKVAGQGLQKGPVSLEDYNGHLLTECHPESQIN